MVIGIEDMSEDREIFYCNVHGINFYGDANVCPSCQDEWQGPLDKDDPNYPNDLSEVQE